jgi:hypothetical protein
MKKKLLLTLALLVFSLSVPAQAKPNEYKAIVQHLKTKYQAKKVNIPFMWLAKAVVSVAHPAGVKSFSITMFTGLKFSRETLDMEMQAALRNSFSEEWIPILRVRSREGQQAYMYMREAGQDIKITLVAIDKQDATVIRATFNPDRLADFINNPKIFGISLDDKEAAKPQDSKATDKKEEPSQNPQKVQ